MVNVKVLFSLKQFQLFISFAFKENFASAHFNSGDINLFNISLKSSLRSILFNSNQFVLRITIVPSIESLEVSILII